MIGQQISEENAAAEADVAGVGEVLQEPEIELPDYVDSGEEALRVQRETALGTRRVGIRGVTRGRGA